MNTISPSHLSTTAVAAAMLLGIAIAIAETPPPGATLVEASKDRPFINSIGMRFVPAGTPGVLFGVWETRVQDFAAFVRETGHDAICDSAFGEPAFTLEKAPRVKSAEWLQKGGSWNDPRFPNEARQSDHHPVVCVSPLDAGAFCLWLTDKEREEGTSPEDARYRLPTDDEWSRACGKSRYPWGNTFPPGSDDGNYSGTEAMIGEYEAFTDKLVKLRRKDTAPRTAPVGSFRENAFGLFDMGGNVWEWCDTWYLAGMNESRILTEIPGLKDDLDGEGYRVLRGAGWNDRTEITMRTALRDRDTPRYRRDDYGFRCVLSTGSR